MGNSPLFASLRSPTVVPGHADARDYVAEVHLEAGYYTMAVDPHLSALERSISRLAARCDEKDRDIVVRIAVSGKVLWSSSLGILHDAYDGRGLVGGGMKADEIVGQFGAIIAKLDVVIDRVSGGRGGLYQMSEDERVLVLGKTMSALQDALALLGRPTASGIKLQAPILVSRHDQLRIEVMSPLSAPARVYLRGVEKVDSR